LKPTCTRILTSLFAFPHLGGATVLKTTDFTTTFHWRHTWRTDWWGKPNRNTGAKRTRKTGRTSQPQARPWKASPASTATASWSIDDIDIHMRLMLRRR